MTTPRHGVDLDVLDAVHAAAQRGMDDTDGESIAAWRRATYVLWPSISKEIRALRAVAEAARPLIHDRLHVETVSREGDIVSCDQLDALAEALAALDAMGGVS